MNYIAEKSNLTTSQLLLWLGQKLNPDKPLYNMVFTFTIEGNIDVVHFRRALRVLIDRSDALRTIIEEIDGLPQQRVQPDFSYRLPLLDFTQSSEPQVALQTWVEERCAQPFNLTECLFDSALIKLAPNRFVWYLNQHHLITDVWSVTLIYRYLKDFYRRSLDGTLEEAPTLNAYSQYAEYERAYRQSSLYQKSITYWQQKQGTPAEPIPFYGKTITKPSARTQRVFWDLGLERSQKLRAIAEGKGIRSLTLHLSLFNIFATILFAYLYRIGGQETLAISTPANNRPTTAFKETIGVFIELFPLKIDIEVGETFLSLLKKVQKESSAFLRYAQPGTSSAAINRGINVILNYINTSFPDFNGLPMQSEWVHAGYGDNQHHLRLEVHDFDATGNFTLHFDFNCDLIPETQRQWAPEHFCNLLDALLEDPLQQINAVEILAKSEQSLILEQFKAFREATPSAIPIESPAQTILEQFQRQVDRVPERTAVVFADRTLTYAELDVQANQLAYYLGRQGVRTGMTVGLFLERSMEMIVAILGILKTGAAYLPFDPEYPSERTAFMLADGRVPFLLTQQSLVERIPQGQTQVISLDDCWGAIAQEPTSAPSLEVGPQDLAYIIYTSGSTGKPKGVMVEQMSVVKLVEGLQARIYADIPSSLPFHVAWVAPIVFDPSVQQIFGALLQGHVLYPVPEPARLEGGLLYKFYQQHQIDISDGTPVHLRLLMAGRQQKVSPLQVKHFIIGGDVLYPQVVAQFKERFKPTPQITNIYGVAECCVDSISHRISATDLEQNDAIPIGIPLPHEQVYLMNECQKLQPLGVAGEIYLGGSGVGRGYWQREELTTERFIQNPFKPQDRLYRTGDLARYMEDGRLLFLGRRDNQIKLRGYRIELGEIEQKLHSYKSNKEYNLHQNFEAHNKANGTPVQQANYQRCTTCLITSRHPGITFDASGVCSVCRSYERYKEQVSWYFQTVKDFQTLMTKAQKQHRSEYDCMLLYSGGKDSSYILYRLVEMGYKVLAFTFDNGFISPAAIANIQRQTSKLGVESIIARTEHMNEIFVESLNSDSTVCSGCFKSLTAISTKLAQEKGIGVIITGLSRGQIFETKLVGLYEHGIVDPVEIEEKLLLFRKMFHTQEDWITQLLKVDVQDVPFEQMYFVDFFRYDRTPIEEIKAFLKNRDSYWQQPKDTGFCSSNCMMNDVGICVHSSDKGYHNYEAPLSWDIRLGISQRANVLAEVEYPVDVTRVSQILDKIGYFTKEVRDAVVLVQEDEAGNKSLCAYFVANQRLTASELRAHLATSLPDYMIPAHFVQVDKIPLTPNGKVDRQALPHPEETRPELDTVFVAPSTPVEKALAEIWTEVLKVNQVGIHDNFFDLGGDSIMAIQIAARINEAGLNLTPNQLFQHPTIAELAAIAHTVRTATAEPERVTGIIPLTPIQQVFWERDLPNPHHWNQTLLLEVSQKLDPAVLKATLQHLLQHHDALRGSFTQEKSGRRQFNRESLPPVSLTQLDLSAKVECEQECVMAATEAQLQTSLNLARGELMGVALFDLGADRPNRLLIIVHRLAVDGVSWLVLLEDLETLYCQLSRGEEIQLSPKTTSFKRWSEGLVESVRSGALQSEVDYWLKPPPAESSPLPVDYRIGDRNTEASAHTLSVFLDAAETRSLLQDVPRAYHTQINEVLLAALVLSFAQRTGQGSLLIDLEGHGREEEIVPGANLVRTVGWFTSIFPVTLTLKPNSDLGTALKSIKEQLRRVPRRGIGYGMLRYLSAGADLPEQLQALPQAEILFNYFERMEQLLPEGSMFRFARELTLSGCPESKRRYLLEINTTIVKEQLRIDWRYSQQLHREATVQTMASDFIKVLRALIGHCLSSEAGGYTPTDFPLAKLDKRKLSKLSNLLSKSDRSQKNF